MTDNIKRTPFEEAAQGDFEAVKHTVEYSMASMNKYDEEGRSLLYHAAISGNKELAEYLVERVGLSITAPDHDLRTPYEVAFKTHGKDSQIYKYFKSKVKSDYEDMYHNPIRRGFYPDPSVLRVGDDYYMVNSTFVFFPCIPISHSRDLINWEIIGYAITNPKWAHLDELDGGRGYWAPDISYDNGTYYIAATYRMNDDRERVRFQMIVKSDKPEGPYSEPVFIDEDGIDPGLFHEDGRHYMLLNRGGRIVELDADCTKMISEPRLLYYGDFKRAPEGPHIYKRNGYYYLLLAEGGTGMGHRVTVARSRELMGIYEPCPYNPIMRQWVEDETLQRCGHGDLVETPDGRWYMVYLGVRMYEKDMSFLGRETFLDPVTWTEDGWPIVNELNGPSALQSNPFSNVMSTKLQQSGFHIKTGDFDTKELFKKGFMTVRSLAEDSFMNDEDGNLVIKASDISLSSRDARNMLLFRQTELKNEVNITYKTAGLENSLNNNREAGLTCYYDENSYVNLYFSKDANGIFVSVHEHIGTEDIFHEKKYIELGDELTLSVITEGLKRTFKCKDYELILPNVFYLCDEGVKMGKRFTGALYGAYAYDPDGSGEFKITVTDIKED